jgi:HEAT repeat protein
MRILKIAFGALVVLALVNGALWLFGAPRQNAPKVMSANDIERLMADLRNSNNGDDLQTLKRFEHVGPALVDRLIDGLRDSDSAFRANCAEALGVAKDSRAVDGLFSSLKDPDYRVEHQAAEALAQIGTSAIDRLVLGLKDPDPHVRRYSAEALGKIGDKRADPPLIAALKDPDPYVRQYVALALGGINDSHSVEPLTAALKDDPEVTVRANSAIALVRLGPSGINDVLIWALNDSNSGLMAKAFLNSGNSSLHDAATEWAHRHGFVVVKEAPDLIVPWGATARPAR